MSHWIKYSLFAISFLISMKAYAVKPGGGPIGGGTTSTGIGSDSMTALTSISGKIQSGSELNFYITGPVTIIPKGSDTSATYGCGNINVVADGSVKFGASIKQYKDNPDSNLVIFTRGNAIVDGSTKSLLQSGSTFSQLRSNGSGWPGQVSIQIDASVIGTSDATGKSVSTFGPTPDIIQSRAVGGPINLGIFKTSGMIAMGSVQNFKTLGNSANSLSGFTPSFSYAPSLKSNPPKSLKVVIPDSELTASVIGSTVEFTDTAEALKFVDAAQ